MRLLFVNLRRSTHPLAEAVLASPLWQVRECGGLAEAEALAASEWFDYVLVDPGEALSLETVSDRVCAAGGQARERILRMPAHNAEFPVDDGRVRYGCRGARPACGREDGGWIFEYHAPCRTINPA